MKTFGQLIRDQRERQGLTLLELALRLGTSTSTISRLEGDDYSTAPKPSLLHGLCRELDLSELELLRSLGYLHGIAAAVEPDTTSLFDPVDRRILEGLARLSDREKEHVLTVISFLRGEEHGATARRPAQPRSGPDPAAGHAAGIRRTG